jgi:uncharacterized protein YkwD
MPKAALALLVLVVLTVSQVAWGDDTAKKDEKPPAADVLLDKPQEATLLLFNGAKRPIYLVHLTPAELAYKGSASGTEVVKYAARDGHILEIHVAGGTFLFNKTTGKFEVGIPLPGTSKVPDKPPEKGGEKPPEKKGDTLQLSPLEQAILDLVNKEREKEGLSPLKPAGKLVQIAREHSANMARQNKLDHFLDGKSPIDRARAVGYEGLVTENCAWGVRTAADVVRGWMNSPGHRANLLGKNAVEAGIGHASEGRSGPYYTMVFGLRRSR